MSTSALNRLAVAGNRAGDRPARTPLAPRGSRPRASASSTVTRPPAVYHGPMAYLMSQGSEKPPTSVQDVLAARQVLSAD